MSLEGRLRIELTLQGGCIGDVAIGSTRPVQASRIFHGKHVATVGLLMPRLFSVCGTAQACAATQALATARGQAVHPDDRLAHCLLLMMETAQEHIWRLSIDGARIAGEPARMSAAAPARALLGRLQRALYPNGGWEGAAVTRPDVPRTIDELDELLHCELFGVPAHAWRARVAETPRWWTRDPDLGARLLQVVEKQGLHELGKVEPRFLGSETTAVIASILADTAADSFIAAPTLGGAALETTPLARHWDDAALAPVRAACGAGLATRFTAFLLELAATPQRMRELLASGVAAEAAHSPAPGTGFAAVEAARGLLCHLVELEGDTVIRYQILAPTEWNFHPHGIVAQSLSGFPAHDAASAKKASELIVQAIDPCVGFEVTVHA